MKAEEQRIAIAQVCGWTVLEPEIHPAITYEWGYPPGITSGDRSILPDYLNSLDAIHEAEKVLLSRCPLGFEDDLWEGYLGELCLAAPAGGMHHATAEQRSKAFLRALNLWKE